MSAKPARDVLLTGFDAFGGERVNPSWRAVRALDGERIAGHVVRTARLRCDFAAAPGQLARAIAKHDPVLVLCVGQAGGRAAVSLERVAINVVDARIPDNAGAQPVDEPVVAGAPAAHFSSLPLKAMLAALRDAGIPAEVSSSAGTFVCNAVFFHLAEALAARAGAVRGGFVHIPYLPQQAARHGAAPSMALETMVAALRLCVKVALTTKVDAKLAAGSVY
jgi:pyroglutamyl-peptidase